MCLASWASLNSEFIKHAKNIRSTFTKVVTEIFSLHICLCTHTLSVSSIHADEQNASAKCTMESRRPTLSSSTALCASSPAKEGATRWKTRYCCSMSRSSSSEATTTYALPSTTSRSAGRPPPLLAKPVPEAARKPHLRNMCRLLFFLLQEIHVTGLCEECCCVWCQK